MSASTPLTDALLNERRHLAADDSSECWNADDMMAFVQHARKLEQDRDELRKDKERIDWWELHMFDYSFGFQLNRKWTYFERTKGAVSQDFDTFRDVLTAAMEQGNK